MNKEIEDYLNLGYESHKEELINDMELYCKHNNIKNKYDFTCICKINSLPLHRIKN